MILYKIFFRRRAWRVSVLLSVLVALAATAQPIEFAVLMPAPDIQPAPELPRSSPLTQESELHPARRALALKPVHDQTNPAYQQLQRIDEATSHLPHDALGFPDWMASLRSGAITPRAGLTATAKMNVLDLDVVMKNTKEMPNVLFPHLSHTLWLDCSNCHPAPFLPQAGANPVSMGEIFRGRYCGMCHDRVAFITFFSCTRCHSVPQGAKLPSK
jgi:c(7)-type cytochrome triheme protein